jgi:glycosyltransferase involved in cell wall biosynthesis
VDNNSTDGSVALARLHDGVRVLHEAEQGAYAARNRALREARGGIIAFTDADCVADPDWLQRILAALDEPDVMIALGPADATGPSRALRLLNQYERHKDAYVLGSTAATAYYGHTNNMALRGQLFDELGPFVHRMRGADTILVRWTVDRYGCDSVRYVPQMRVRHMEIDSVGAYFRKVRTYGGSQQSYRRVTPARPLTVRERLRVFRQTLRDERLSIVASAQLALLLAIGAVHWYAGSLASLARGGVEPAGA